MIRDVLLAVPLLASLVLLQRSSTGVRGAVDELLQQRAQLLAEPKRAVEEHCRGSDPPTQICKIELFWRQNGAWVSPCRVPPHSRRYPVRYYQLSLDCRLAPTGAMSVRLPVVRWKIKAP